MNKKTVFQIIAILLAIGIWQIGSVIVGTEMLLASPYSVIKRLITLLGEGDFLKTVLFSVIRIGSGFLLAFSVGITAAFLASRFSVIQILLRPYMITIKTVPIASFVILCLIWFSYSQLTVFIAFLIALPVIYMNVLQGIKSVDPKLKEMARLYHMSWGKKLIYLEIPSVKPFLFSACNVAIGMTWKAGVAAEVIGNINGSVGERLYQAKIYFQNADLLAWTVVIILLSLLMEKLFGLCLKLFFREIEKR